MENPNTKTDTGAQPLAVPPPPTGSAIVSRCDVCGNITAIDLAPTPERRKDMEMPDHSVLTVSQEEGMRLWKTDGGRCDHKKLVEELRAALSQQNVELSCEASKPKKATNTDEG